MDHLITTCKIDPRQLTFLQLKAANSSEAQSSVWPPRTRRWCDNHVPWEMFFVPPWSTVFGVGESEKLDPKDGYCWMDRILPKGTVGSASLICHSKRLPNHGVLVSTISTGCHRILSINVRKRWLMCWHLIRWSTFLLKKLRVDFQDFCASGIKVSWL